MKITNIKAILTAPANIGLCVVRVQTDQAGLYGVGCATFNQRLLSTRSAIEDYLKPLLIGRDPERIEDIWHLAYQNSYWRNSPVLNNALSGVDEALWDIKGKIANQPLYQLFGGKSREGVAIYAHADGNDPQEVLDNVHRLKEMGIQYIRCQMGGYGGRGHTMRPPEGALPGAYFDPWKYMHNTEKMFEFIRSKIGFDTPLLHDVHERLAPIEAVRMARMMEPFRLFFFEDALAPEDIEWFERIRQAAPTVPLAMGELFTHPLEWKPLIVNRLIDFIRVHISDIGGITPALKLANLCEAFGVRTAFHGPGDVSPVGHAANLHLDLHVHNFGIQEFSIYNHSTLGLKTKKKTKQKAESFNEALREVFPGCPELREGYLYANAAPGLGIDVDETAARKYPIHENTPQLVNGVVEWTQSRYPDGTLARP